MGDFSVIFESVPDPRDINARHDLREMLFIVLAAMLCGAESCVEMAEFGVEKEALLRTILDLKHGIPSHDTFSRVLRLLDPAALESAFIHFMEAFRQALVPPPVGRFWRLMARACGAPTKKAERTCRR
jgi:hypothetical protein